MEEKTHEAIGAGIGRLVDEKNIAYGNSFAEAGKVMRVLYPDGILPSQYDDALGVIRIVDKLFRLSNEPQAFGESPWADIAGYGLLGYKRSLDGAK